MPFRSLFIALLLLALPAPALAWTTDCLWRAAPRAEAAALLAQVKGAVVAARTTEEIHTAMATSSGMSGWARAPIFTACGVTPAQQNAAGAALVHRFMEEVAVTQLGDRGIPRQTLERELAALTPADRESVKAVAQGRSRDIAAFLRLAGRLGITPGSSPADIDLAMYTYFLITRFGWLEEERVQVRA